MFISRSPGLNVFTQNMGYSSSLYEHTEYHHSYLLNLLSTRLHIGVESISGPGTGCISGQATLCNEQQSFTVPAAEQTREHCGRNAIRFIACGRSIRRSLEELHMHQAQCEQNPFDQEWIWVCKENFGMS